jgi:hypothetical protein
VKAATSGRRNGNGQAVTLKVGQSGTIVLRGLGRNPLSMYPGQAKRVARDVFGLDDEQYAASPLGKWVAGNPVETYSRDADYAKHDGGLDKLQKAVAAGYATVSGDTVAVSLAPDRD